MPDPDRVQRSRLDMARQSSAPAAPPSGAERFYVNASGALRQKSADGTDAAAGGGGVSQATLDAAIATTQPLDSDLTAIAALSTTSYGRALLALADAAAARTALGLGTAATHATGDYDAAGAAAAAQAASQPLDATLTAFAALAIASGKLPYGSGSDAFSLADLTAAGRALLDDADAAAQRATLGLGSAALLAATALPGAELDYAQITSPVNVTATAEATADTIVTGNAVVYDGSTPIIVEFVADQMRPDTSAGGHYIGIYLFDGSSSIGFMGFHNIAGGSTAIPANMRRRLTPSAATHTYSIRAAVNAGTGLISAGAGGSGAEMPAFLRITKAN
jgi:hypothetical protein